MDAIIRDTIFAGMSEREFIECVGAEVRRREMAGVLYVLYLDQRGASESYSAVVLPQRLESLSVPESLLLMYKHALCMPAEAEFKETPQGEDWSK